MSQYTVCIICGTSNPTLDWRGPVFPYSQEAIRHNFVPYHLRCASSEQLSLLYGATHNKVNLTEEDDGIGRTNEVRMPAYPTYVEILSDDDPLFRCLSGLPLTLELRPIGYKHPYTVLSGDNIDRLEHPLSKLQAHGISDLVHCVQRPCGSATLSQMVGFTQGHLVSYFCLFAALLRLAPF